MHKIMCDVGMLNKITPDLRLYACCSCACHGPIHPSIVVREKIYTLYRGQSKQTSRKSAPTGHHRSQG